MWKGIRAHKDLNLNLTPRGAGRETGVQILKVRWSLRASSQKTKLSVWLCHIQTIRLCQTLPSEIQLWDSWAYDSWSSHMYSVNPTWRGPPPFSLIWHCCSSHVTQHCLSTRIPRRDIVFGILTRGFILLITEVDRSERICWQECHPARRLHSAMTLGADDVKSNQNVGGSIIMLENIGSQWYESFRDSAITSIEFADWSSNLTVQ